MVPKYVDWTITVTIQCSDKQWVSGTLPQCLLLQATNTGVRRGRYGAKSKKGQQMTDYSIGYLSTSMSIHYTGSVERFHVPLVQCLMHPWLVLQHRASAEGHYIH